MLLLSGRPKSILATILLAAAFSLTATIFNSSDTSAANKVSEMTVDKQAESWWRYKALEFCINSIPKWQDWNSGANDLPRGNWFPGSSVTAYGPMMRDIIADVGDDFATRCGHEQGIVSTSLSFWGVSGLDLLCGPSANGVDLDTSDNVVVRVNREDCFASEKAFAIGGGIGPQWNNKTQVIMGNLNRLVYDGNPPSNLVGAQRYYYYWQTLKKSCIYGAETLSAKPTGNENDIYEIAEWKDGKMSTVWYLGNKPRGESVTAWPGGSRMGCGEMADAIKNPEEGLAMLYGALLTNTPGAGPEVSPEGDEGSSSCLVEGVGWIICPVINFTSSIADGAFSVISGFLQVNTSLLDTNNGTYTAWSAFRNLANVAFVIVFLIIIFSQLTGAGVTSYGLKKTLPRLIIAAILVNISFLICQLAVDVTQILGGSLRSFLSNIPVSPSAGSTPPPGSWTEVMGDILGGGALVALLGAGAVAGGVAIALSIGGSVLLAFLIAVLITVLILIARQALIVILIIIAPLAFVAYLLPNTESWFKKWYKMFWALLLVYPIVALLFGGGELASKILSNIAADAEGAGRLWLGIMAIGVSAIPLIMAPALLKGAIAATGTLGAKLSGMAGRANSRIGKNALTKSRLGEAKQGLERKMALRRSRSRTKENGIQAKLDRSRFGKAVGLDRGAARAISAIDKETDADVDAEVARIFHGTTSVNRIDESAKTLQLAIEKGDTTKARAAQKVLLGSGAAGIDRLQKTLSQESVADQLLAHDSLTNSLRSDINSAGLKSKNSVLARWGYQGAVDSLARPDAGLNKKDSSATPAILQEHAETYTKLNPVELAGQSMDNLKAAVNKGHIKSEAAAAVLANSAASGLLDGEKRQLFERLANSAATTMAQNMANGANLGGGGTRPPSAPAAPSTPSGFQQSDGGLWIPRDNGGNTTAPRQGSSAPQPPANDSGITSTDKRAGGNGRPPVGL